MAQVTLREIADRVGCTRSTVSYALRHHPSISAATRKRVQAAAKQLGWKPDTVLHRQMALVRSTITRDDVPALGVIISRTRDELRRLPTIRRHLEGVTAQAEELGFTVNVINLKEQAMKPRRLANYLKDEGIRGLALMDLDLQIPREYWALATEFATVSVGVDPGHTPVNVAFSDYHSIGRRAINELRLAGFHRPGLVLPRGVEKLLHWGFTAGYHSGIVTLPEADRLPIFYSARQELYIESADYAELLHWIDQYRPDVLLGIDTVCVAACISQSPRHARLPVYSLDWHPGEGAVGGIDQRPDAIGRAAVNILVAQLSRGEVGLPALPLSVVVREDWVPAPPPTPKKAAGRKRKTA